MQIKKYRSGLLIIVYIAFGVYCFVIGDNGILERFKLIKAKSGITENIDRLKAENRSLQNEFSIVSNDSLNKDVYKKEASASGFIAPGEKYIYFKGEPDSGDMPAKSTGEVGNYPVKLSHLRILWGITSLAIILLYLARKNKSVIEE